MTGNLFLRADPTVVEAALARLGVRPSSAFVDFFQQYYGPIGSESVPYQLQDLVLGSDSILEITTIARQEFRLPSEFLVLTNLFGGAVLMLDTKTDQVFDVDFEGGLEHLLGGTLAARWNSFYAFLEEFF